MNQPTARKVRLFCDACDQPFLGDLCDIPLEQIGATPSSVLEGPAYLTFGDLKAWSEHDYAATLCGQCGDAMVRLESDRIRDPRAYDEFIIRVAESAARKLRAVPVAN